MGTYPSAQKSFDQIVDSVDILEGIDINVGYDEIEAMQSEMGVSDTPVATSIRGRLDTAESDIQVLEAAPGFGSWASKSDNTTYLAATDGFVTGIDQTVQSEIKGYTDGNNPPTTLRAASVHAGGGFGNKYHSITMPVRSGDRWKVTGCDTVYWLPNGS